jgi:hypothetical protein
MVRAIVVRTHGIRLQVDYGKDKTARVSCSDRSSGKKAASHTNFMTNISPLRVFAKFRLTSKPDKHVLVAAFPPRRNEAGPW